MYTENDRCGKINGGEKMSNLEDVIEYNKNLTIENIKHLSLRMVMFYQNEKKKTMLSNKDISKSSENDCILVELDNGISVHIHYDPSRDYVSEQLVKCLDTEDKKSDLPFNMDSTMIPVENKDTFATYDEEISEGVSKHPGDIAIRKVLNNKDKYFKESVSVENNINKTFREQVQDIVEHKKKENSMLSNILYDIKLLPSHVKRRFKNILRNILIKFRNRLIKLRGGILEKIEDMEEKNEKV